MIPEIIIMGGAAFRTSHILTFATKKEWVKSCMKIHGYAFPDKSPLTRETLFGQIYDLAKKK